MALVSVFATWTRRRWITAIVAAVITALAVGLPTDVIPNPVFGRAIEVTLWSYPSLVITSILAGLLIATYVREPDVESETPPTNAGLDRPGRAGGIGGFLTFFAVGCPTCNKLVIIALGSSGALDWFAPAQPILAIASIALLGWALKTRLANQISCAVPA
ncbi:MAG: hypothetical protein CSA55_03625 [Ilumatobacter coccineus]|uniref:Uncharacterized protein n=1 Tax=Ilumatobacter coccineus TaxID=467094 RepID=A0A2G6K9D6_9ACTN|nr:MAG: hypothetical protein CSA55_03625 [Ilumatobacter coccineus]